MVVTSALHAEGPGIEPQRNQIFPHFFTWKVEIPSLTWCIKELWSLGLWILSNGSCAFTCAWWCVPVRSWFAALTILELLQNLPAIPFVHGQLLCVV